MDAESGITSHFADSFFHQKASGLDDEIQTQAVATNGYLEGRTWKQFFEEFNGNLSSLIHNEDIRQFYRNLFWLYKRVLWSFSGIKDEKLKTLGYVRKFG